MDQQQFLTVSNMLRAPGLYWGSPWSYPWASPWGPTWSWVPQPPQYRPPSVTDVNDFPIVTDPIPRWRVEGGLPPDYWQRALPPMPMPMPLDPRFTLPEPPPDYKPMPWPSFPENPWLRGLFGMNPPEEPKLNYNFPTEPQPPVPQIGGPAQPLQPPATAPEQQAGGTDLPQQPDTGQPRQPVALSAETLADIIRRRKNRYQFGMSPEERLQEIIRSKQQMANEAATQPTPPSWRMTKMQ